MKTGDHLVTKRNGYTHHGLYIGNDEVIHYSGNADGLSKGSIEVTSVHEFSDGHSLRIKEHLIRRYDENESVERARSRLGEDWYNVLVNNCEHFVTWCIVGFHSSSQVNSLISGVTTAYKFTSTAKTAQTTQAVASLVARQSIEREAAKFVGSNVAKSTLSNGAGLLAGSSVATGGSTALGLVASASVTPLAPIVAGVAVAYGVKKAFGWLWD